MGLPKPELWSTTGIADRNGALLVFSQSQECVLEIGAWCRQAERFFEAQVGLAESFPCGGRIVIAPIAGAAGIRSVEARPRTEDDVAQAQGARAASGLTDLVGRCKTVWLVERQGAADWLALRLAAIMASLFLGPILDLADSELFGVRSARAKMAAGLGPQVTRS